MSTVMPKISSDDEEDDLMGKLPDDVLIKIIIKLPAETLIQLVPYSKQFRRVITDPQFAKAHFQLSSTAELRPTHWLSMEGGRLSYSKLTSHPTWNTIEAPVEFPECSSARLGIVGSARGVMCLVYSHSYVDRLFLWNPCVNRFITVPIPLPANSTRRMHYGFGFHGDFKIVQLAYEFQNVETRVYEAKSGRWRTVDSEVPCYVVPGRPSVFVNGVVYWLAIRPTFGNHCIMGFDLVNEVFKVLLLPGLKLSRNGRYNLKLKRLRLMTSSDGKSLALFVRYPGLERNDSIWGVWYFMNDVNDSPRWGMNDVNDSPWCDMFDDVNDFPRWEGRYNLVLYRRYFHPLCILNDDHGEVLAELGDGRKCVMKGVVSDTSDFTLLGNTIVHSSQSNYTSYTPSLALLGIEDTQPVLKSLVSTEKRKVVRSSFGLIPAPKNKTNHY